MKIKQEIIDELNSAGVSIPDMASRLGVSKQAFYARQRASSWRMESLMCFSMVASIVTGKDYTHDDVVELVDKHKKGVQT